jgi:hypothetical protein
MSWGQVWSLVNVGMCLGSLINTSQSSNDQQGFGLMLGEYLIFEEKAQSGYLNNNNNFKTPLYESLNLKNYSSSNSFFGKFSILLSWPLFSRLGGLK